MGLIWIILSLLTSAPTAHASANEKIDILQELNRFFDMSPMQSQWAFKSLDGNCEFIIEFWSQSDLMHFTLQDNNVTLGTSFRAITHREETTPLFNDKTYFSYYSDFSNSDNYTFLVEGVYEYLGSPEDAGTKKVFYHSRSLHVQKLGEVRYVTYTSVDRSGTESKSCVF